MEGLPGHGQLTSHLRVPDLVAQTPTVWAHEVTLLSTLRSTLQPMPGSQNALAQRPSAGKDVRHAPRLPRASPGAS